MSYEYDGDLLRSVTLDDGGRVSWNYDEDFAVQSETVCDAQWTNCTSADLTYDDDKLLQSIGELTLTRDAANGLLTTATVDGITDSWSHNSFGEPLTYESRFASSALFREELTRDDGGRITAKRVILGATTTNWTYGYDAAGRLIDVTKDGTATAHYEYDPNGNRLSRTTPSGTDAASCDGQDRMTSYGTATYAYAPNGELESATDASGTTQTIYDEIGNLIQVRLPDARVIDYVIDGQNRRVGRKADGTVTHRWLYSGQLRVGAELDAAGSIVSRFVYGTRSNIPDYMVRGGVTYRFITDHLGSPFLAVNSSTGAIAQQIEYDEFGNVLSDSNPAFQPFGFAGGQYDRDTGFVTMGAREYAPHTGRFITKDPIGFAGNDTNVYAYVMNDPVNPIDPTGLEWYEAFEWLESDNGRDFTNFAVGFGDASSFGLTRTFRDEEDAQWMDTCSGWYTVGVVAGTVNSYAYNRLGYTRGYEFKFGRNLRIAPWGNRTNHPLGEYPHYHRRGAPGPNGQTPSGQGIGRHRPFETSPVDSNWWRRF